MPNPPGGIIVRNAQGDATGMLLERARDLVAKHLEPLPPEEYRSALKRQIKDLNEVGITSLTNPRTLPFDIEQLTKLHQNSLLNARVHWTVDAYTVEEVLAWRARYELGHGDYTLRFSGIGEPNVDGGIEAAYLREPYNVVRGEQDNPSYRGIVMPPVRDEKAFADFYAAAIDAGFNVMTHVTGDGGLDLALRILTEVSAEKSFERLRWTLHGCFLADAQQLAQIKKLGLYITAQSQPYLLGAQMAKWWGRERANRSIPIRAFLDAGITVGGGSDAPAGIANPLESLGWMVNRLCLGGLQLDRRWSITPEEALVLYTRHSAETQFMETRVGTLNSGLFADIAVLDTNPLTVAQSEIGRVKVGATLIDGRVVFDRHGLFA
jgi:predicted amidohydrolase YtcJ